ncbi:hypothetical protein PHMEG_00026908 [Phytophthora megakarya]|uniref:Necrosis inducing protein NPP1 n=1 Tax=Phytophthora megakarya TaxID=4795 RepID=A0A225V860_9STRA|nr:hypothetical protein PHMEG_00026908 [Phytophthora megakarya]
MNLQGLAGAVFAVLFACATATVDHDKVQPIPQPEPVTVSEKVAVEFKPRLIVRENLCVSFPAINAAGEVTGGLKGTNGNDACTNAPLGSQVYGRAGWYKDVWAMMYAWYFPKGFWAGFPSRRHNWASVVVWIDNPAVEKPKVQGVARSTSDSKYSTQREVFADNLVGARVVGERFNRSIVGGSSSLRFEYLLNPGMFLFWGTPYINLAYEDGEDLDLIMWEQLTDAARATLNNGDNFGRAEVPFSDEHFEDHLKNAWPL